MSITIELEPEMEAAARPQAEARGLDLSASLQTLIKHSCIADSPTLTREEFEREWLQLSEGTAGLPVLSDDDLTRAVLYADHD